MFKEMNFLRNIISKKNSLKDCNDEIPYFSFNGIKTKCKIISFYDGDTCKIVFKYNGKLTKLKCRLAGIDTPEIHSTFLPEIMAAASVKDYVSQYNGQILTIHMYDFDKYGRTLIELFDSKTGLSINTLLVEYGMAYCYDGKTKKSFLEWYKLNTT